MKKEIIALNYGLLLFIYWLSFSKCLLVCLILFFNPVKFNIDNNKDLVDVFFKYLAERFIGNLAICQVVWENIVSYSVW